MPKIKLIQNENTIRELINEYLSNKALEVVPRTISSYKNHFHALEQYIDFDSKLDKSVCLDLYAKIAILDISQESKNSYMRTWKAFINRMDPTLPKPAMHHVESIKPTYSDEDIKKLITPPKRKYDYTEYRNFVMTLVLFDTGIRAGSLRNIKPEDVQDNTIVLRHNKTKKVQIVPFGTYTAKYLKKFAKSMTGYSYLFCNQYGKQFMDTRFFIVM